MSPGTRFPPAQVSAGRAAMLLGFAAIAAFGTWAVRSADLVILLTPLVLGAVLGPSVMLVRLPGAAAFPAAAASVVLLIESGGGSALGAAALGVAVVAVFLAELPLALCAWKDFGYARARMCAGAPFAGLVVIAVLDIFVTRIALGHDALDVLVPAFLGIGIGIAVASAAATGALVLVAGHPKPRRP